MKQITLDDVASALNYLDFESREVWIQMGMAIKSEFGDSGWDVWNEWSQRSKVYDAASAKCSWNSFRKAGIGIGTLIRAAKVAGWVFNPRGLDDVDRQCGREAGSCRKRKLIMEAHVDEQVRFIWNAKVADASLEIEKMLYWRGTSPYLERKKIQPYGIGFARRSFLVVTYIKGRFIQIVSSSRAVSEFFSKYKAGEIDRKNVSFKYIRYGTIAIPMRDESGKLWSWQFINESGDKQFLKFSRKRALFHFIAPSQGSYHGRSKLSEYYKCAAPAAVAQVEGYATGASVHQATGYPVAVAFDSGNMPHVSPILREVFHNTPLLICGDNDCHVDGNPGLQKAKQAALISNGIVVVPSFGGVGTGREDVA